MLWVIGILAFICAVSSLFTPLVKFIRRRIVYGKKERHSVSSSYVIEDIKGDILTFVVCVVIFSICWLLANNICNSYYTETLPIQKIELVSIQDTKQSVVSGGAFRTSYIYVTEQNSYSYYYKHNGGYKFGEIRSCDVTIYEQESGTPRIDVSTTYTRTKNINSFVQFILSFKSTNYETKTYSIYVPKGSINRDIFLDAK